MNENAKVVENFHGVYLLYCKNPKYEGRTYIGYTVDPNRRIKQHNLGKQAGGAWKTSNRGPWVMVLIVHGFPSDISALRFEWAWQHPYLSRRLKHVTKKKAREKVFEFCVRVLSEMLVVGPWNRLPLTVQWLSEDHVLELQNYNIPPVHVLISIGPVTSKKVHKDIANEGENLENVLCSLCHEKLDHIKRLVCLNTKCDLRSHVICLSKYYLEKGEFIPIEGMCPICKQTFLWGDIIRKYKGCYSELNIERGICDDLYNSDSI